MIKGQKETNREKRANEDIAEQVKRWNMSCTENNRDSIREEIKRCGIEKNRTHVLNMLSDVLAACYSDEAWKVLFNDRVADIFFDMHDKLYIKESYPDPSAPAPDPFARSASIAYSDNFRVPIAPAPAPAPAPAAPAPDYNKPSPFFGLLHKDRVVSAAEVDKFLAAPERDKKVEVYVELVSNPALFSAMKKS